MQMSGFAAGFAAAVAVAVLCGTQARSQASPPQVPDDVAKAIDSLGDKIKGLQAGNAAVTAAVKKIDTTIQPLRNRQDPDYIIRITGDLTDWIKSLTDPKAKSDAWIKVKDLWAAATAVRDPTPVDAIAANAGTLTSLLDGPLSDADVNKLQKSLHDLGTRLDKLVTDRGPRIHIISARYGDVASRKKSRTCDAKAYFVGACEGKISCPGASDTLNASTLCGYEPAPLAADGTSYAEVRYKCINFGLRKYPVVDKDESTSGMPPIKLHPKDKIVCNVNSGS